jgi:hypothetical protein
MDDENPEIQIHFFGPSGEDANADPETVAMYESMTDRERAIMQAISIMAGMQNGVIKEEGAEALLNVLQAMGLEEAEYFALCDKHNDMVDRVTQHNNGDVTPCSYVTDDDIPTEVLNIHKTMTPRQNAIMNIVGVIAWLRHEGHEHLAHGVLSGVRLLGEVTMAEFEEASGVHNMLVKAMRPETVDDDEWDLSNLEGL